MIEFIKRLFRRKPQVREVLFTDYRHANLLLQSGQGWRIAPEEDRNQIIGMVWIERPYKAP